MIITQKLIKLKIKLLKTSQIINKKNSSELNEQNNLNITSKNSEHNVININNCIKNVKISEEKNRNATDNGDIKKEEKEINMNKVNNKTNAENIIYFC